MTEDCKCWEEEKNSFANNYWLAGASSKKEEEKEMAAQNHRGIALYLFIISFIGELHKHDIIVRLDMLIEI